MQCGEEGGRTGRREGGQAKAAVVCLPPVPACRETRRSQQAGCTEVCPIIAKECAHR